MENLKKSSNLIKEQKVHVAILEPGSQGLNIWDNVALLGPHTQGVDL